MLYEDVAQRLERLIHDGTLLPGHRLPSVRHVRDRWGVSVATAQHAFRVLETRGLVEARPRSGYFVRDTPRLWLPVPEPSVPLPEDERLRGLSVLRETAAPDLVALGTALPDPVHLPLSALGRLATRIMRESPEEAFGYALPPGPARLRRAIAAHAADAGANLQPSDIITTTGAMEAIYLSLAATTQPGDRVLVQSPTYFGIIEKIQFMGRVPVEVPSTPERGLDLGLFERMVADGASACVLVPNFNNPCGSLLSDADKARLVKLCVRAKLPLIEDDLYGELAHDGQRPSSLKAFDRGGWVLSCSSVSKVLSPGLRVGWVAPGRFYDAVLDAKLAVSFASASLPQLVVASYLEGGGYDTHIRRLRAAYRDQVSAVGLAVRRHFPPGTRCTRPSGGHVLWVQLPEGVDAIALYRSALRSGVGVAPGPLFSPTGRHRGYLRLNCASPFDARTDAALAKLGALCLRSLTGRG
ncbi:MAG: PLP-dependent aminotransferase family protein [Sandaracinaceae bacterium]|jgi:DNA-binding transcriptional MocR family regulator|nr:PLP-dependent aminotransferase family protein [Sandaracinaceae bacterium]MBK7150620.1 PLP-dependent aminotransferase family protein [Sandaracinaceae bacterium]MBK8409243.1 PLP-dependent aminotransferase family protein [Sandaracinaceae bacterium]MBP7683571.1 PLP-dependent aminotransferase family protein [Deltaproteobacteria bacterium]